MAPRRFPLLVAGALASVVFAATLQAGQDRRLGRETAMSRHLADGEELSLPLADLIEHGRKVFEANWTEQDGAGRPLMTGAGEPLSAGAAPLRGARGFNRVSGPDANSCRGCHNEPYSIAGGSGDFVTGGFELAERFDFVTRKPLAAVGNPRATPGLFGAGYLEMLARQMTEELQRTRDAIRPGQSRALVANGVSFGVLARRADGSWNTARVEGLPPQSLVTAAPPAKPSLVIHPWRQSGSVVSLREFAHAGFFRHMGMQTAERFGAGRDSDGDGVANELTRGDVTAVTVFQATLPVPGRVIPNDPAVEQAIASGERLFARVGCTACHVPSLRLARRHRIFAAGRVAVDLTSPSLPQPRLAGQDDFIDVPAYTDFKLHDITDPADPSAADPFDMNHPVDSAAFNAGNRRFLTARLWGAANQSPYFHHGQFTTMRQAILAHAGEALEQRQAFQALSGGEQDALVEFLKSLQVLPPGTKTLIVDEHGRPKRWPAPRGGGEHGAAVRP